MCIGSVVTLVAKVWGSIPAFLFRLKTQTVKVHRLNLSKRGGCLQNALINWNFEQIKGSKKAKHPSVFCFF